MIKYAICGNIASGKSTTQTILEQLGYKVLDCDDVCHNILNNNSQIIKYFENFEVFEDEIISRDKLGKIIFTNPKLKKDLEDIMHPIVREEIKTFFLNNLQEQKIFVAVPLLFEANMQDLFDRIMFIYTDDDIRLKRLIERNKYTLEYANLIMNAQMSQVEKMKRSDIVIFNNGSIKELEYQIIIRVE